MITRGSRDHLRPLASSGSIAVRKQQNRWRELAARGLLAGLVATAVGLWIMMVL